MTEQEIIAQNEAQQAQLKEHLATLKAQQEKEQKQCERLRASFV